MSFKGGQTLLPSADPERRERGSGLRYPSLSLLSPSEHPWSLLLANPTKSQRAEEQRLDGGQTPGLSAGC